MKVILIIVGIVIVFLAIVLSSRARIVALYKEFLKVENTQGITGKTLAVFAKDRLNLTRLNFGITSRELHDCYVQKKRMLVISEQVANSSSVASLAIVSHEIGHAIQHENGNALMSFVHSLRLITRLTNLLIMPCAITGVIMYLLSLPSKSTAITILIIAASLFALNLLCKLVTIPLEYDASDKALAFLKKHQLISKKELKSVKKLLNCAALTYVASLLDGIIFFKKQN